MIDTKISNDAVSTSFEVEARTWMDSLKGRINRGEEIFQGKL